jgi:CCR4-NOT transcription complex subunit 4
VSSGLLPDPEKLIVFKSPLGFIQRLEFSGDFQDAEQKLVITEEDRATLQAGKPVHKIGQGSNRIMLTPNGDCVRNLTPAEEERYLELQSRIMDDAGPATFMPPRHNVSGGFALIGGRAVPNGPPAYFPPLDASSTRLDPVGKIQRDEALSYINQFVLPSLSTNSQLERALNANALDAEMLRPNDLSAWSASSLNPTENTEVHNEQVAVPDRSYGVATRDNSILATGLQSMTAHFALGQQNGRTQPLGNVALLSLEDSEKALQSAKKETEKLEKSLNQLLKKNRRLLLGAGH